MNCNCKWTESVLALLILVFAFWQVAWSQWIIVIAAVILLLHSWMCKTCAMCQEHSTKKGKR